MIEKLGKLETNSNQVPSQYVTIAECGEIKDGKDIPCEIKKINPFGMSGTSNATPAFPSSNKSPFGNSTSGASGNGGFSFGATGASINTFSFASGVPASGLGAAFGMPSQSSKVETFSFEQLNSIAEPSPETPSFSFGSSDTNFGGQFIPHASDT